MKLDELRGMSVDELSQAEINAREDLFRARFQHHTGQLSKTSDLGEARRTVARIKTLRNETAQAASKEGGDE